jgi:hypothetical protein
MENSYAEGIAVSVEKAVSVAILRQRQFYANGQLCGLPKMWPTPTTPTFGRRRRCRPSALFTIPMGPWSGAAILVFSPNLCAV